MPKRQHGGSRPGSGRPKGTKNPATIEKEAAREAVRQRVLQQLEVLVRAQIAHACGVHYLVVRDTTTGKFLRVGRKAAEKLNPGEEVIEVWEKDPSVQAFTDLMNRAIGRPKDQDIEVNVSVETAAIPARLAAARKRLAQMA
jgi:hypothetical protein